MEGQLEMGRLKGKTSHSSFPPLLLLHPQPTERSCLARRFVPKFQEAQEERPGQNSPLSLTHPPTCRLRVSPACKRSWYFAPQLWCFSRAVPSPGFCWILLSALLCFLWLDGELERWGWSVIRGGLWEFRTSTISLASSGSPAVC